MCLKKLKINLNPLGLHPLEFSKPKQKATNVMTSLNTKAIIVHFTALHFVKYTLSITLDPFFPLELL